jgi:hypothetical protein
VPVWAIRTRPVVQSYTVTRYDTVPALAKAPSDTSAPLKLGMITGTDNDIIGLACSQLGNQSPRLVRDAYLAATFTLGAWWTGLVLVCPWYVPGYVALASAWSGFAMMGDINNTWGDIIGDRRNDGFIALSDQGTGIAALGAQEIVPNRAIADPRDWARPDGSKEARSANHLSCRGDDRIWGTGLDFDSHPSLNALKSSLGIVGTWAKELSK